MLVSLTDEVSKYDKSTELQFLTWFNINKHITTIFDIIHTCANSFTEEEQIRFLRKASLLDDKISKLMYKANLEELTAFINSKTEKTEHKKKQQKTSKTTHKNTRSTSNKQRSNSNNKQKHNNKPTNKNGTQTQSKPEGDNVNQIMQKLDKILNNLNNCNVIPDEMKYTRQHRHHPDMRIQDKVKQVWNKCRELVDEQPANK